MDVKEEAIKLHEKFQGKLEVHSKVPLNTKQDLTLAYTPGVAEPCLRIAKNKNDVYKYTFKGNMVAIVTNGTAVLGLGDIGPQAGLPVMEGKALLLKRFANVDAFPICLDTKDSKEIANIIQKISPGFGGINLEDIAAPYCVEIERILEKTLDIPLFHDDQHGTAVVTTAGILNALKLVKKTPQDIKVVIVGAGASGYAITRMLAPLGFKDILAVDIGGILYRGDESLNFVQQEIAQKTNIHNQKGTLSNALEGADLLIGVSVGNIVTQEMVRKMNKDSIIFATANPTPEIFPQDAKQAGAFIVGTGRSDFPNQINNVLAMPGIFRGTFDAKATRITEGMKLAASKALASLIDEKELTPDYIIPNVFDERVVPSVAKAVKDAAIKEKVIRI
jgi:malate dehydrogenase (oxaloacetate-decarboxylating)